MIEFPWISGFFSSSLWYYVSKAPFLPHTMLPFSSVISFYYLTIWQSLSTHQFTFLLLHTPVIFLLLIHSILLFSALVILDHLTIWQSLSTHPVIFLLLHTLPFVSFLLLTSLPLHIVSALLVLTTSVLLVFSLPLLLSFSPPLPFSFSQCPYLIYLLLQTFNSLTPPAYEMKIISQTSWHFVDSHNCYGHSSYPNMCLVVDEISAFLLCPSITCTAPDTVVISCFHKQFAAVQTSVFFEISSLMLTHWWCICIISSNRTWLTVELASLVFSLFFVQTSRYYDCLPSSPTPQWHPQDIYRMSPNTYASDCVVAMLCVHHVLYTHVCHVV